MYILALVATTLLGLIGPTSAFWRLSCGIVQSGRVDPVVSPGKLASHAHKIAGAENIGISSTYETLQQASCTSCAIGADKSAYWTPILYYQHANGTFEEVPNDGMTIYYLGRGNDKDNIQPFPPGFRMLSGNTILRSYDDKTMLNSVSDRPQADRVSFACLDSAPSKEQPYLWRTQCKNGLRAQIHFQSCWDGQNLYKEDQSHVAYMSGLDNGVCPPTHPVSLVHMFFEVLYSVDRISDEQGGKYVFSNGDTTGYGFHGDFLNGWDKDVLAAATTSCANTAGGRLEDCEAFAPTLNTHDSAKLCPAKKSVDPEPVHGLISKLPGCVKVTGPGGPAALNTCGGTPPYVPSGNTTLPASSQGIGANYTKHGTKVTEPEPTRRKRPFSVSMLPASDEGLEQIDKDGGEETS